MRSKRLPWEEELTIIDRTMKAISGVTDPETLVGLYWDGIGDLIGDFEYVSLSRRGVESPKYLVTRSSRFTTHPNPWTERELLPLLSGGILGELVYANKPVMIDNLSERLTADDPGHFFLEGFERAIALPQYDNDEGLNVSVMLLRPGEEHDRSMIPILHWQSGLFGRGTQNLVLRNQLSGALDALDRELDAVGDIQRSLLPESLPSIPGFEVAAYYETSARAGGDYYDFFPLDNGAWGLFIADVSGHGTPAAVLMAITHAIAHAKPGAHQPPQRLIEYLNNRLTQTYTRGGTFITAFYAVLDPATRTLTYSRAGHNPPRLVRGDRVISLGEASGLPLGIVDDHKYDQSVVQLEPGDLLLLYTDGITEANAPALATDPRELFELERLDATLIACGAKNAEGCIARVRNEIAAFTGNAPPTDDRTLIALRCL